MITGPKERLDPIAREHSCPEHGQKLTVAWNPGANSYVIRCGEGHFPEETVREMSQSEMVKAGTHPQVGDGYDLRPTTDLGSKQPLTPATVAGLITFAEQFGLDARLGHVQVMYGKPYVGIDGYLYHANKSKVPYRLVSRPLTEEERKAMRLEEDDHAWKAEVERLDNGQYFSGLGIVTDKEVKAMSTKNPDQLRSPVVAAHPWQLCQKRAEWQGMRRAFPIEGVPEQGEG